MHPSTSPQHKERDWTPPWEYNVTQNNSQGAHVLNTFFIFSAKVSIHEEQQSDGIRKSFVGSPVV